MASNIIVNMSLTTRPAIYTPKLDIPHLNLKKGEAVNVDVLGIYQVIDDDGADAYFVVILPTGRCKFTDVEAIQFTDMEDAHVQ